MPCPTRPALLTLACLLALPAVLRPGWESIGALPPAEATASGLVHRDQARSGATTPGRW